MGQNTPWGEADDARMVAPGITSFTTPSHGGILLSDERRAAMPKPIRSFQTFAGSNWYEEDCDVCLVVLAFPDEFDDGFVRASFNMLCSRFHHPWDSSPWAGAWVRIWEEWEGPDRRKVEEIAAHWENDHWLHWEGMGGGTMGEGWTGHYRQIGTGLRASRKVTNDEYYARHTWEELPGTAVDD